MLEKFMALLQLYLKDSNFDVRTNAKRAILTLKTCDDPIDPPAERDKMLMKYLDDVTMKKVRQILEAGEVDDAESAASPFSFTKRRALSPSKKSSFQLNKSFDRFPSTISVKKDNIRQ